MKQIAFKLAGFVFYFYFCLKSQSYLHEADCLYHGRLYVFALMLSACRTPATQLKEEQNMGNQMIIETLYGEGLRLSVPQECLFIRLKAIILIWFRY